GAHRELTRLRGTRALGKAALHEIAQDDRGAVAGNLYQVFRRVGMWRAKADYHYLIEHPARFHVCEGTESGVLCFERPLREFDEARGDFDGAVAGEPHHSQTASARGRGDCDDGVLERSAHRVIWPSAHRVIEDLSVVRCK